MTDTDAELLAMEISGAALPPPELYEQIHQDLAAIRQAYPAMVVIRHRPRWAPGELTGRLTTEAMAQFEKGEYHGLDTLTAEYGPVDIIPFARLSMAHLNFVQLRFEQRYNPEYLAPLYTAADGVESVNANWVGGDGDNIEISESNYIFSVGWGDCLAGCIHHHYWVFSIVDDAVTLVDEYGSPLITGLSANNNSPTILGSSTKLTARVKGESYKVSYAWNLGDGTSGEGAIIDHTYPAIGNYTAVVTANSFGSTVTATTKIVVIPPSRQDDDH